MFSFLTIPYMKYMLIGTVALLLTSNVFTHFRATWKAEANCAAHIAQARLEEANRQMDAMLEVLASAEDRAMEAESLQQEREEAVNDYLKSIKDDAACGVSDSDVDRLRDIIQGTSNGDKASPDTKAPSKPLH